MAEKEPNTHLQLMLPVASGVGLVGYDKTTGSTEKPQTHNQLTLLGLSMGRDFEPSLRIEIYGALVTADSSGMPRGLVGLHAGPRLSLLDRRDTRAIGAAVRFVGLVGIAYRGQKYNWLHDGDGWVGQRSIALTATPAIEATYYSSSSFGWTARLKPQLSYVVDQIGSPIWADETSNEWDGYRWGLSCGLDFGVAF